jgi:hypothetical protein
LLTAAPELSTSRRHSPREEAPFVLNVPSATIIVLRGNASDCLILTEPQST